ncbi:MAG: prephenate/arogenate dehydrogenase family protein [Pseudomonadota bacterium]
MAEPVFQKLTIIGVGLIGASIAQAARLYGAAADISVFDIEPAVREQARQLGLGTVCETAEAAVEDADCVILCVPVGAIPQALETFSSALKPGAILTDVGSVKSAVADKMAALVGKDIHVIPGHPIAGTEKSGPQAGFASLFQKAWVILTPISGGSPEYDKSTDRLALFWQQVGSTVEIMDAAQHDRVLAITSHLPHLIAYNIVSTAYDMESVDEGEVVKYSAGGFRDFTRIAASDPTMWRDVFLNNREAVLETLGRFSEDLAALQRAIRYGDGDRLFKEFERARGIRKAILDAGQDSDTVNFGRNQTKT